jgi:hypothetical protein
MKPLRCALTAWCGKVKSRNILFLIGGTTVPGCGPDRRMHPVFAGAGPGMAGRQIIRKQSSAQGGMKPFWHPAGTNLLVHLQDG